jgi:hypothetical protein
MSNTDKLMQRFLRKLDSVEVQETFDLLSMILEELENKNDPEPFEMHIVNNAYQIIEKLSLVRGVLTEKLESSHKLTGSRLQDLYDRNPISVGTQALFDYNKKG